MGFKKCILAIIFVIFICGCLAPQEKLNNQEKMNDYGNLNLEALFLKYEYTCAKVVDHSTFDYDLQQAKIAGCQSKCCDGGYCGKCQWPGYSECYANCEANTPEGRCVNCDGVCWESGHKEFLDKMISDC